MSNAATPGQEDTNTEKIEAVARILVEARIHREPLGPIPDDLIPSDAIEAQRIDDRVAEISGWDVLGWKIGCTSEHAQEMLGSPGPFAGRVYSVFANGVTLGNEISIEPKLEGEIAFRLSSDIASDHGPVGRAAVIAAIGEVMPAIEFVGGRFLQFVGAPLNCLIADAGANTLLVLGDPATGVDLESLDGAEGTMTVAGEVTGSGTGADVLGHPLNALQWLVDHLWDRGISLKAGQVVTTGTATQVSPLPVGATAVAAFSGLGSVSVTRAS